jgi:hypothetical protein
MRHSRHHKEKEKRRYYLLPGMGGRLYRQKQKFIIKWSVIAALVVAGILVALLYWLSQPNNIFIP